MFGIPKIHMNKQLESIAAQRVRFKVWRKFSYALLVIATSCYGVWVMFDILKSNSLTGLEISLLLLFSITFGWIASAFWSGAIGFILQLFQLDPMSLKRTKCFSKTEFHADSASKTAIVMPVYNEDTRRVIAGFETCIRALADKTALNQFDFYLLSDTQDPALISAERNAWGALAERLGSLKQHIFYRRRTDNRGKKVGNLTDFCERWGRKYEFMIVLDADSIMTGQCMLDLVDAMQQNPDAGLVQTVPIPVRQSTFFGRFLQFAAQLYSPMLATGLAFWQTDGANYWGHNAIIRTKAFIQNCGLPELKGRGAFGGEILSHDFVEAALLNRAGWQVILRSDIQGSFEEVPANILDYAIRDRRWVQGNIQHLALLPAREIKLMNKLHFSLGALAYISSLIWLSMLMLSSVDAITRSLSSNVFFEQAYQLFPTWKIAKPELIYSLIYLTSALLLLPKVMGVIIAILYRRKQFGGAIKLVSGFVVETLFAILIAPMMMAFHAYFVLCVMVGHKVSWEAQSREGRMVSWRDALSHTVWTSLAALIWGTATYYYAPVFFYWLLPVLAGLVIASVIIRYSSSVQLGLFFQRLGIFSCPSENIDMDVLTRLDRLMQRLPAQFSYVYPEPELPAELKAKMPVQSFDSAKKVFKPRAA